MNKLFDIATLLVAGLCVLFLMILCLVGFKLLLGYPL